MTDAQALELLRLLHAYVTEYGSCSNDVTLGDVAEDLVESLDTYNPNAEALRDEIEGALTR
jgi:hypothetical protein